MGVRDSSRSITCSRLRTRWEETNRKSRGMWVAQPSPSVSQHPGIDPSNETSPSLLSGWMDSIPVSSITKLTSSPCWQVLAANDPEELPLHVAPLGYLDAGQSADLLLDNRVGQSFGNASTPALTRRREKEEAVKQKKLEAASKHVSGKESLEGVQSALKVRKCRRIDSVFHQVPKLT